MLRHFSGLIVLLIAIVACQAAPTPFVPSVPATTPTLNISSTAIPTTIPLPPSASSSISSALSLPSPTRGWIPTQVTAPPTRMSNAKTLELLSRLGGDTGAAVTVAGNYVYLSTGYRIVVLDLNTTTGAMQVGQGALLPSAITSLAVNNGNLYATTESAGVQVFTISNAKQPNWIGAFSDVKAQQIVFSGDYAYTVDEAGFYVYRVTDPTHWTRSSSIANASNHKRLAVVGKHAYFTGDALRVIDVSNPSSAQQVGVYTGMQNATDLAVVGNNVWVVTGNILSGRNFIGELHVVDVSNPTKPTKVNSAQFDRPTRRLLVAHGFVYVGAYWDLHVFDASDAKGLREISKFRATGGITDLAVFGTQLLIASSDGDALQVVGIAHPEKPSMLQSFYTPKSAHHIAVAGQYAYVSSGKYGFLVADVNDPRVPVSVGESTDFFEAWGIAVSGKYLYVTSAENLRIIQLINPTYGYQFGSVALPLNGPSHVSVVGNRAYVAGGKFFIVDVSQPDAPKLLSTTTFSDNQANDVALFDHYAIVASTDALHVIDVADAAHPKEIGSLKMTGWARSVSVVGNNAYVVTSQTGLHLVSLANPAKPIEIGFISSEHIESARVAGTVVFMAEGLTGMRAFDISNPSKPVEIAEYKTSLSAEQMTISGNTIFATTTSGGMAILHFTP